jgi:cytochrome P450
MLPSSNKTGGTLVTFIRELISPICWFLTDLLFRFIIVAMLHFPEIVRKAQAELDRVVGHDRMPEYEDYDSLLYVRAVMNESLRWRPVAVLGGTPHAVIADDVYNGM